MAVVVVLPLVPGNSDERKLARREAVPCFREQLRGAVRVARDDDWDIALDRTLCHDRRRTGRERLRNEPVTVDRSATHCNEQRTRNHFARIHGEPLELDFVPRRGFEEIVHTEQRNQLLQHHRTESA